MTACLLRLIFPLHGLVILGGSLLQASPITWQPAQGVTDPAAVNSRGVLIEAVNASPAGGVVTVNGVNFSPSNALLPNNAVNGALNGLQTLDSGLDELLTTMDYGGGQATSFPIGAGRLVSGNGYIVQVFFTDMRDCCSGRVMTFGDGDGNTVDVGASGGEGQFGQVATGTFTADEATQSLTLAVNGFGNAHINAYQVRTAFQLPVIESFTATPPQIAGGETCMLAWQVSNADSVEIDMGIGRVGAATGEVTVSPAVTTTYTLSASNEGGLVSALVTVGVDVPVQEPVISEFLAANDANLADADGDSPDWIEIYNPNVFAIDLGGYFLTDDPAESDKWRFPEGTALGGGEYLVVFASGADRDLPRLHAGFRLDSSGGYLALIAPDGSSVLSGFTAYPPSATTFPTVSARAVVRATSGFRRPAGRTLPPSQASWQTPLSMLIAVFLRNPLPWLLPRRPRAQPWSTRLMAVSPPWTTALLPRPPRPRARGWPVSLLSAARCCVPLPSRTG